MLWNSQNVCKINAHAHTVCTRPSSPHMEGLGMRLDATYAGKSSEHEK